MIAQRKIPDLGKGGIPQLIILESYQNGISLKDQDKILILGRKIFVFIMIYVGRNILYHFLTSFLVAVCFL